MAYPGDRPRIVRPLLDCCLCLRWARRSRGAGPGWLALLGVALAATGCGVAPSGAPPTASAVVATPAAALAFPRQAALPDPQTYPAAEMRGILSVVGRCLRVIDTSRGTDYLPIWHHDFTLSSDQGVVAIRDAAGQVLWRVGDTLNIGGGEVPADAASWLAIPALLQEPPADCPGPYWLVGSIPK